MGGMKSREERRTSERRVLLWSLTIAVVVHVLAFLYLPGLRPNEFADLEDQTDELALVTGSAIPLDLFFGPPVEFSHLLVGVGVRGLGLVFFLGVFRPRLEHHELLD